MDITIISAFGKLALALFGGALYLAFKAAPFMLAFSFKKWKEENLKTVFVSLAFTASLSVAFFFEPTFLSSLVFADVDIKPYQTVINFLTGPIAAGFAVTALVRNFLKIQVSKLRGEHKRVVSISVEPTETK